VRIGKQITLSIEAEDAARAQQRAARMCESLLTNTVIEDYSIEVVEDE
jgi:phosphoribosylformylglycinamidine synthase